MELSFKIGTRTETVQVPDEAVLGVLEPNHVPVGLTDQAEVCRALAEPIGTPRLRQIVRPGEKVAIVTSDITRPMPTWVVLPPAVQRGSAAGGHHAGVRPGQPPKAYPGGDGPSCRRAGLGPDPLRGSRCK